MKQRSAYNDRPSMWRRSYKLLGLTLIVLGLALAMPTCALAYATVPAPQLVSFTPTSGPVRTVVTLTGMGFSGATAVTLNGY